MCIGIAALALIVRGCSGLALVGVYFSLVLEYDTWNGTFCGGLRWWGHPSFYVRGNVYNIRCYLSTVRVRSQILPWYKFLLATKVPMTQILPVRWPRELIYQYEVSYIMFQRYRIVLLVRYSLTTLYRIFRQGTGHKDFAARVLTLLSLSLSRAVQYWRHIENVFN